MSSLAKNIVVEKARGRLPEIENTLNDRLLTYVEDDVEHPILTPNTLVIDQNLVRPDKNLETENKDLCKRFKYTRKCKEAVWLRWRKEYIKFLRILHNMKTKDSMSIAKVGEVIIITATIEAKGSGY